MEGANSYRYSVNVSTDLQKRHENLSKELIDIAWKAQVRLCARYQYLTKRGKNGKVIKVAIAREMLAYIWEITQEIPQRKTEPYIVRMPA